MELISRPGWFSDRTWLEMRCNFRDLDAGKTSPRWRWDVNIETWIEVRHNLDGCETLIWVAWMEFRHNLDGCEMIIYGPGWKWDGTWMGGDIIFFWSGLRWDRKRMLMRCKFWNLAGFDTVSVWSWDVTLMGVRCNTMDLHEVEMVHGCRWDDDIWIWIQWDRSKLNAHLDTRMAFG